jgi:predicted acyl esterase
VLQILFSKVHIPEPGELCIEREDGELLKPGENAEMKIGMYATSVLIGKGHKIRVSIAGSDTSNFARIPDSGEQVIRVQRNSILSSYIELPVKK